MSLSSHIGFGTAAIGRPQYINIRHEPVRKFSLNSFKKDGIKVLEEAYNMGIRYFDTAPGYGIAEEMLMDWVRDKDDDSIEIASKWGYTYTAEFNPKADVHEVKEHTLEKLNEQWKVTKDLIPFLSTYQIHSATFDTGVLGNIKILERLAVLKEEYGLHIGITTSGMNQVEILKEAMQTVVEGIELFDAFQITYNLLDQSVAEVTPHLLGRNKRIIIKEALANGKVFPNVGLPQYSHFYEKLQKLAYKYRTGIDALALRFCIDSIGPYKVLSGAATASQLKDNLKANQLELEEKDLTELKKLSISPKQYWRERKQLLWN